MTKPKKPRPSDAELYCRIYRREIADLRSILDAAARGAYTLPIDPYGRPLESLPVHIERIEQRIAELSPQE